MGFSLGSLVQNSFCVSACQTALRLLELNRKDICRSTKGAQAEHCKRTEDAVNHLVRLYRIVLVPQLNSQIYVFFEICKNIIL